MFGEERKWKRREWYKRKKVYKIIGRYRLSRRKPQGSGGGNAAVVCVRYASWHISEKRSPLEVYSASCTYIDGSERERASEGPSSSQCVRHWKKGRKGWLSLPPRLVGANEGGTDRPVCTLPLSGSCRASTPNRIHVALRSLCATPCLSPFFFRTTYYEILPTEK